MLGTQRLDGPEQVPGPGADPGPGGVRLAAGSASTARRAVACMASATELMALRVCLAGRPALALVWTETWDGSGSQGAATAAADLLLLGDDWRRAGPDVLLRLADRVAHGAQAHQLAAFMAAPEEVARGPADPEIIERLLAVLATSGRGERLKRGLDLVLSALGLVVLAPLLGVIALAVRLDSPGPVFFVQERLGRLRVPFRCIKFRTMCDGAERRTGPVWASEDDPRITRVGRLLRRSRLDELPQLLNVVRGEMSLVGARPIRAYFADQLAREIPLYDARFLLRPGVTGWAQVHDNYVSTYSGQKKKFLHDYHYLRNRSTPLDLLVLLMTILVMVRMKGG